MRRNNTLSQNIMASTPPIVSKRIETRMLIAKMLYDYLNNWEITQQELANKMGKRPSEVSKWLSGDHNFTIDTLSDIGYYLGTDFLIKKNEMASFRCARVLRIDRPNIKTGDFGTKRINTFVFTNEIIPNNKKVEKCPA